MKKFTLIEIILALFIAVVGIIGIMGLMSTGLMKNKETVQKRSVSDVGDQFLHNYASLIKSDWNYIKAIPDSMSTDISEHTFSTKSIINSNNLQFNFKTDNISDEFDYEVHKTGIFKSKQFLSNNVVDFESEIRAWKILETIDDQRLMGDIMPWGLVDTPLVKGTDYVLKYSSTGNVTPGNFGVIDIDGSSSGGANEYIQNILNGSQISIGSTVRPQTGNLVGPTITAISSRLSTTPYIRIPIVTHFPNGNNGTMQVINIVPFKLNEITGTSNLVDVSGTYIGSDNLQQDIENAKSYKLTLIIEVSWPLHLSYDKRNREYFRLRLYKAGNIVSLE